MKGSSIRVQATQSKRISCKGHRPLDMLAFTRYCPYEYCIVPGTQEGGREGRIHCAILFVGNIQGCEKKELFRL